MSKAASIPSAVRRPLSSERGSLTLFGSLAVLIAGFVSLDTGLTGVGLFIPVSYTHLTLPTTPYV